MNIHDLFHFQFSICFAGVLHCLIMTLSDYTALYPRTMKHAVINYSSFPSLGSDVPISNEVSMDFRSQRSHTKNVLNYTACSDQC